MGKKGKQNYRAPKDSISGSRHTVSGIAYEGALHLVVPNSGCIGTAIDPQTRRGREMQWKHLSPNYDYMTCIENPPDFAQQLGIDFARQGAYKNNVRCDFPGLVSINSVLLMNTIADWHNKSSAEGIPEGGDECYQGFPLKNKRKPRSLCYSCLPWGRNLFRKR